jgi:hypothetical protein
MNSTIPLDLLELQARFETWRTNRKYVREPIPDELWNAAADSPIPDLAIISGEMKVSGRIPNHGAQFGCDNRLDLVTPRPWGGDQIVGQAFATAY